MLKSTLIGALLIATTLAAGCRRVVLVSFTDSRNSGLSVDKLSVEGKNPVKEARILDRLSATLGYFDISTSEISLHTVVCSGDEELADVTANYPVMNDAVVVSLILSDQHVRCPIIEPGVDAGTGGSGEGGAAAGGAGGGAAGSAGTGGMMTTGAGGDGGADTTDAGVDTAECGTDTHAPACNPPTPDGGTSVPPPASFSAACDSYCQTIQTACTGANSAYDSSDTCRRYCNDVAWPAGNGRNNDDSLGCRTYYATLAAGSSFGLQTLCAQAGPSGGNTCGPQCEDFCAALSTLCPATPHLDGCMTACGSFPMGTSEPRCRFAFLQKAVFDSAYCDFAGFDSCLKCDSVN